MGKQYLSILGQIGWFVMWPNMGLHVGTLQCYTSASVSICWFIASVWSIYLCSNMDTIYNLQCKHLACKSLWIRASAKCWNGYTVTLLEPQERQHFWESCVFCLCLHLEQEYAGCLLCQPYWLIHRTGRGWRNIQCRSLQPGVVSGTGTYSQSRQSRVWLGIGVVA